jgi:hypothetical protein
MTSYRLPLVSTGASALPADLPGADASPKAVVMAYHERPLVMGRLKDVTGSFTAGLFGLAGMLALAAFAALLTKGVKQRR